MRFVYGLDLSISYYRWVLRGLTQFAKSRDDVELHVEYVRTPGSLRVLDQAGFDGMVLGTPFERSKEAARLRTPAISVSNTYRGLRFPKVVTDDCEVGRIVARHLLNNGYRNFAFWHSHGCEFSDCRWSGFASTITGALGEKGTPSRTAVRGQPFRRWLMRLPRPLGLMAAGDDRGAQAIVTCRDLGLRIPEDVAIVGVNDDEMCSEVSKPPLSSVALLTERIGYLAAERLACMIRGETIPEVTIVPPGPLVVRGSSQAIATSDELVVRAVSFIEQSLARGVNVAETAKAMDVSRKTLELRFRAALRLSPGQAIVQRRIERAQSLLATTGLPVKQVATLSGFGTAARMGHVFRRSTGETPLAHRRRFALGRT